MAPQLFCPILLHYSSHGEYTDYNTFFIKMQKIQQHFYGIVAEIYGFYTDLFIFPPSRKSDYINGTEWSEKTCRSLPGDASVKSLQNFLRNSVFPEIFSKVDPPL